MEDETERRLRAKYISIGRNIGRKEERGAQEAEKKRVHKVGIKKGRKIERKILARERGRKKWDWKHRVFSVEAVIAVAFSIVTLKVLEILAKEMAMYQ